MPLNRASLSERGTVNLVAYIVAIILFILAGLGVTLGELGALDLIAFGLAAFALGHILPR